MLRRLWTKIKLWWERRRGGTGQDQPWQYRQAGPGDRMPLSWRILTGRRWHRPQRVEAGRQRVTAGSAGGWGSTAAARRV